jgi:hypothetical protein
VSFEGKTKTSDPVAVRDPGGNTLDPLYAPYHGTWKWAGPTSGADARDEFVTISFDPLTNKSTFKYHDTQKTPNDSFIFVIDTWESANRIGLAADTWRATGYKLSGTMGTVVGTPGSVAEGASIFYYVFLNTGGTTLVRSRPNWVTGGGDTYPAGNTSGTVRVYDKQQ